ncbi:MAG: MarR family transcriptional regulator [Frankiales bacterium]|nr:MarR family transcriptional regulator [Frankiales bacterium]
MDPIKEAQRQWEAHGWADAAPGMAAVTSVMRAQQIYQAAVDEVLKPFDLTFARYELLMLLLFSSRGSLPLKKASLRLQVHPTSVTNAVDRLARAELVERLPHPTDGRGTLVSITEDGRRIALKATEALNANVFSQPGLAPRRVASLLSVLEDLRKGTGDLEEP